MEETKQDGFNYGLKGEDTKREEAKQDGFINVLYRTIERVCTTGSTLLEKAEEIESILFDVGGVKECLKQGTVADASFTETMLARLDTLELNLVKINKILDKIVQI